METNSTQEPTGPLTLGAAWKKTSKKTGSEFISVAPTGNREQDEYEVILRRKSTQEELDLFNPESCSVIMLPNTFKDPNDEAQAKKPDFTLKVFLK